jgi:hypothetical protein
MLCLPAYSSPAILHDKLKLAITDSDGFALR